jgi:predicted MFS family arabinose efflux permease
LAALWRSAPPAPTEPGDRGDGDGGDRRVRAALRHVRRSPDLLLPIVLVLVVGMFAFNMPMKLALLAKTEFRTGPATFGLLSSAMAVGALAGAGAGAWRRRRPAAALMVAAAATLAVAEAVVAVAPSFVLAALSLVPVGFSLVGFHQAVVQRVALGVGPGLRGRVLAMLTLVSIGAAPFGGLFVGWTATLWGARGAIALGAGLSLAGALAAAGYLAARRRTAAATGGQSPDDVRGGARRGADRPA